jgi:hypothetical protein
VKDHRSRCRRGRPRQRPARFIRRDHRGALTALSGVLDARLRLDSNARIRRPFRRQCARLRAIVLESRAQLKAGEFHSWLPERNRDAIRLAGDETIGNPFDRQLAGSGIRSRVKVTRVTGLFGKAAGEPRRRAFGVAVRGRGPNQTLNCQPVTVNFSWGRCGQHQRHGAGRKYYRRKTHLAFCSAMRPTLLASVPNHIMRVVLSKYMWRMVPLTSMLAKNRSVFGSKPTRRFAGPVSVNQMRP